jgi:hypothetical protein
MSWQSNSHELTLYDFPPVKLETSGLLVGAQKIARVASATREAIPLPPGAWGACGGYDR